MSRSTAAKLLLVSLPLALSLPQVFPPFQLNATEVLSPTGISDTLPTPADFEGPIVPDVTLDLAPVPTEDSGLEDIVPMVEPIPTVTIPLDPLMSDPVVPDVPVPIEPGIGDESVSASDPVPTETIPLLINPLLPEVPADIPAPVVAEAPLPPTIPVRTFLNVVQPLIDLINNLLPGAVPVTRPQSSANLPFQLPTKNVRRETAAGLQGLPLDTSIVTGLLQNILGTALSLLGSLPVPIEISSVIPGLNTPRNGKREAAEAAQLPGLPLDTSVVTGLLSSLLKTATGLLSTLPVPIPLDAVNGLVGGLGKREAEQLPGLPLGVVTGLLQSILKTAVGLLSTLPVPIPLDAVTGLVGGLGKREAEQLPGLPLGVITGLLQSILKTATGIVATLPVPIDLTSAIPLDTVTNLLGGLGKRDAAVENLDPSSVLPILQQILKMATSLAGNISPVPLPDVGDLPIPDLGDLPIPDLGDLPVGDLGKRDVADLDPEIGLIFLKSILALATELADGITPALPLSTPELPLDAAKGILEWLSKRDSAIDPAQALSLLKAMLGLATSVTSKLPVPLPKLPVPVPVQHQSTTENSFLGVKGKRQLPTGLSNTNLLLSAILQLSQTLNAMAAGLQGTSSGTSSTSSVQSVPVYPAGPPSVTPSSVRPSGTAFHILPYYPSATPTPRLSARQWFGHLPGLGHIAKPIAPVVDKLPVAPIVDKLPVPPVTDGLPSLDELPLPPVTDGLPSLDALPLAPVTDAIEPVVDTVTDTASSLALTTQLLELAIQLLNAGALPIPDVGGLGKRDTLSAADSNALFKFYSALASGQESGENFDTYAATLRESFDALDSEAKDVLLEILAPESERPELNKRGPVGKQFISNYIVEFHYLFPILNSLDPDMAAQLQDMLQNPNRLVPDPEDINTHNLPGKLRRFVLDTHLFLEILGDEAVPIDDRVDILRALLDDLTLDPPVKRTMRHGLRRRQYHGGYDTGVDLDDAQKLGGGALDAILGEYGTLDPMGQMGPYDEGYADEEYPYAHEHPYAGKQPYPGYGGESRYDYPPYGIRQFFP